MRYHHTYIWICPLWRGLMASEALLVTVAKESIVPSMMWRSNHASGRQMLLKIILWVMNI